MLQATKKEQAVHIAKILGADDMNIGALPITRVVTDEDHPITFDMMAEIVDYLRTSDKKDDLFEECWKAYRRKGSKKKAKEYWKKLKDDEKDMVLQHIKAYVASRELQYQKDFERYLRDKIFTTVVYDGNNMTYDPTQYNSFAYTPQGRSIWYDEATKTYWTDDNFYYGTISDGYTDENRPHGASITLNNGRGTIVWDSSNKKWDKQ